jgi:hypothetical protein
VTVRTTSGHFQVGDWHEDVVVDIDDEGSERNGTYLPSRGFTVAAMSYTYSGGIEGSGTCRTLIAYQPGEAPYVGFEQVVGSVDGHEGSFVLQHAGTQDGSGISARLTVVPGLGTGALEGLTGHADIALEAPEDDGFPITLHYDLG